MKKQRRSLKELYALAKGKPVNCCQPDPSIKEDVSENSSNKCCATKSEKSCC